MSEGRIRRTSYHIFPGIELVYNSIHVQSVEDTVTFGGNVIEICHCREGRMEFNLQDEFCYITPGDIIIVRARDIKGASYFPIGHYHGISVFIDVDRAPKCLSCFLDDVNVEPKSLAEKFCKAKQCFIARSNPSFEHIFSEIYSVDENGWTVPRRRPSSAWCWWKRTLRWRASGRPYPWLRSGTAAYRP